MPRLWTVCECFNRCPHFPAVNCPPTMNKDPFKIAFGGARCTAQLIRSSGNGAVYRIENEHGDTKVLKLYNAAKFVGHMQQTLTREHRAAIRLLFDWASTVEFRYVRIEACRPV